MRVYDVRVSKSQNVILGRFLFVEADSAEEAKQAVVGAFPSSDLLWKKLDIEDNNDEQVSYVEEADERKKPDCRAVGGKLEDI